MRLDIMLQMRLYKRNPCSHYFYYNEKVFCLKSYKNKILDSIKRCFKTFLLCFFIFYVANAKDLQNLDSKENKNTESKSVSFKENTESVNAKLDASRFALSMTSGGGGASQTLEMTSDNAESNQTADSNQNIESIKNTESTQSPDSKENTESKTYRLNPIVTIGKDSNLKTYQSGSVIKLKRYRI